MIIKTENFELEISTGNDIYFASNKLGQNFRKWDDLEENEKFKLEIIQEKVKKLISESEEILSAKETADYTNRDRRSGIDRRKFSFDFFIPERRNRLDRRLKTKNLRLIKTN